MQVWWASLSILSLFWAPRENSLLIKHTRQNFLLSHVDGIRTRETTRLVVVSSVDAEEVKLFI